MSQQRQSGVANGTLRLEALKLEYDYLKHLTTLATGSILLIVTFLEKLFSQPLWKPLVGVALASFTLSIVAALSLAVMTILQAYEQAYDTWDPEDSTDTATKVGVGLAGVIVLGFLSGIISLVAFALRNLY